MLRPCFPAFIVYMGLTQNAPPPPPPNLEPFIVEEIDRSA